MSDFRASVGGLIDSKKQCNLLYQKLNGESVDINVDSRTGKNILCSACLMVTIQKKIFNADETLMFHNLHSLKNVQLQVKSITEKK